MSDRATVILAAIAACIIFLILMTGIIGTLAVMLLTGGM